MEGLYYVYDAKRNILRLGCRKYVKSLDHFPEKANGENGKVYSEFKNEPYAYFNEITDTMKAIGATEVSPCCFDIGEHTVGGIELRLIERGLFHLYWDKEMEKYGFDLYGQPLDGSWHNNTLHGSDRRFLYTIYDNANGYVMVGDSEYVKSISHNGKLSFPDEANGNDGVLFLGREGEPYNYVNEIARNMEDCFCERITCSIFKLHGDYTSWCWAMEKNGFHIDLKDNMDLRELIGLPEDEKAESGAQSSNLTTQVVANALQPPRRFLNDDVKLQTGGRRAPRVDIEFLRDKLNDFNLSDILLSPEDYGIPENDIKIGGCIQDELYDEYGGYFEPMGYGKPLVGYHTLENGFTFLGLGGFGEYGYMTPVYFIVYWDGKSLRMYVPVYGNVVNRDFGCFLGQASDYARKEVDFEKLVKKYRDAGLLKEDVAVRDEQVLEKIYLVRYGVLPKSVNVMSKYDGLVNDEGEYRDDLMLFNWEAIKQDIMTRIELI